MLSKFKNLLIQMKPLRVMLAIAAIILCIFAASPGTKAVYQGFEVVTTLVFPALTPLVFLVLLLDSLMNRVWLVDATGDKAQRFRNIMRVDLILAGLMFLLWIPYFIAIWD